MTAATTARTAEHTAAHTAQPRRLSVVIPYFQRQPGLLRGAVASIAGQHLPWPTQVEVLIVDDASPHPAEADIDGMARPDWLRLRILRQANAGPATARNRGLDHLDPHSRYVAFLDSDDRWAPMHVATALAALEQGHDFYFCDSAMPEPDCPGATLFGALALLRNGPEAIAERLADLPGAFRLPPSAARAAITREYLCQTSAVVLRRSLLGERRFAQELRYAGEDWLMWVDLIHAARGVCFAMQANSLRGEGINLYRGAHERRSPRNLCRLMALIRANERMAAVPGMSRTDQALCRQRRRRMRTEAASILLHPASAALLRDPAVRQAIARLHPSFWRGLPGLWAGVALGRLGIGTDSRKAVEAAA